MHTHRAPPCFPSAVSVLLFTMPSHLSWPTGKTLPAPTSWTIHPSSTLWLSPASKLFLSPSLTFYQRPRPLHAPKPHPPPLSKGGAKLKRQLRCILAIYFDFWKGLRIHRCCVHYSSTFKQCQSITSATRSWPSVSAGCWSRAGPRERAMYRSWRSWCYAASRCSSHTPPYTNYSRYIV